MSDTALLVIDLQNDYFPGGAMQLVGANDAGAWAAAALGAFRAARLPVFHVRHLAVRPGATFFIPGTVGAEINTCAAPAPGEAVIEKHFPNSFRGTDLRARIDETGAKHLVVAGMMTHMCVDSSVRQAFDLGYRVTLLSDACATRDQVYGGTSVPAVQVHAAFLAALDGLFAQVARTSEIVDTLPERV